MQRSHRTPLCLTALLIVNLAGCDEPRTATPSEKAAMAKAKENEKNAVKSREILGTTTTDIRNQETEVAKGAVVAKNSEAVRKEAYSPSKQYISAIDKPHRHFTAIRRGEIDNNAALVAIEVVERTIAPVAHAAFLAGIGRLHLDHIGAHIAEQQAGSRPGHDLPHFDNVYSFQR